MEPGWGREVADDDSWKNLIRLGSEGDSDVADTDPKTINLKPKREWVG